MQDIILGSLIRQAKGTELLCLLLREEYALLREGQPDQVAGLEMGIQELIRQLVREREFLVSRLQLAALDTAQAIEDMDIPGFRLHPLKGEMRGRWSITVNGNWRITFEFQDGNAYVLDYEDYH